MERPLLTRFAIAIRPHRVAVLILMAVLLGVGGYGASKSQVDNSLKVWQSTDAPEWLAYQQFLDRSKLADPLILLLPEAIDWALIRTINASFTDLSVVSSCQGTLVETVQGTKVTLFNLIPVPEATPVQLADILEQVPVVLHLYHIKSYHLGGVWYLTKQLDSLSAKATTILFPVVLLVVTIVVFFLCRSATLLILSCGLIPAVLLVGIMGLSGVKMNMVLLALPPLTLILGMAHAIHFCIKKWQVGETAVSLFVRVAPPCILSGLTTALGFASLLLSSYGPVQQLGFWGAVGTLLSLCITFVLVPLFVVPAAYSRRIVLPQGMSPFLLRNKKTIFVTLILSLLLAGIGINRLQKGSLILDFFTANSEIRQNYHTIEDAGIGLTPIEVDLFGRGLQRDALDIHLKQLSTIYPEISHFLLTMENQSTQVISLGAKMLIPAFFMKNLQVERFTILIRTISSEETLSIADEMEVFFQNQLGIAKNPYITGSVPLYTRGQKELFSSMLQSFSLAFLSISLLIGILLRSLRIGLIAMVPNLLPVVFVVATMGWVGIPLSVATMTVASIIFGIVVDDTIHMLYGYQKQNKKLPAVERMEHVFREVGSPIITTTLVTGTGFLAFLASPFIPLGHFGLLISLALWMALLCDFFVLPVLLLEGEKHV